MPRYDYLCETCGVMELEHSMNEEIKECPTCKREIKKMISASPVIWKCNGNTPKFFNKG